MDDFDLLDTVLPQGGWFAVLGIKGKTVEQKLVATRAEVDLQAAEFVEQGKNVFFGCAKFATDTSRKKINVLALKSLWLDIDCAPEKAAEGDGYETQLEGMTALRDFCSHVGLPQPTIINSGRGLHTYWVFDREVSRAEWEPVANRLRELCVNNNFLIDGNVFDAARVLRIPGTKNFKQDPPLDVTVLNVGQPIAFDAMKGLLGVKENTNIFSEPIPDFVPNEVTLAAMSNTVQRFKNIMVRGEHGCQQLNYAYANQGSLQEPLWWSALTVANECLDRTTAIHMMSSQHPNYDQVTTERKAAQGGAEGGPHRCETFEKHNPGGCKGCKWKGKIPGPIALAKEVDVDPEQETAPEFLEDELFEADQEPTHKIPKYPFPYQRPTHGGIYLPAVEEAEPFCVYEHDLYVVKCMKDPNEGHVVLMRLHLPHEGILEFTVPLAVVAVKEELRKVLAKHGVAGTQGQMAHLASFVTASVKNLQYQRRAEIMRTQFGWADDDTKFVIGEREISRAGIYGSPASSQTRALAAFMKPKGTLAAWKEVFNLYARPGLEGNAFAALTAFGAPLFKFTGQKGAIVNVIYKHGGTGKSTTLFMCNSVYGNPEGLCSIWKDTSNAKMQQLGVMNNLPFTIDEITNISPEEFSDLAYGMSQGRGKNRMKGSSNELRENTTTWQTISLASANASFYEKLGSSKVGANAEMLRLFEYEIAPSEAVSVEEGKFMFDHQLKENYGHAGDIFIRKILSDPERVVKALIEIQNKLDTELSLTAPERFWSAVAACNITGGMLAKECGLHDFDMKRVYQWVCKTIRGMREEIKPPSEGAQAVIGDYINRHMQNILVVKADADKRTSAAPLPSLEPRGELLVRYEPDSKLMYIITREFKNDCVERQINYKNTLAELKTQGFFKESANKRMSKGMKITSPAVSTLIFDCSDPRFLDMDELIPVAEDVSRGD